MPVQYDDFLRFAESLMEEGGASEIHQRNAGSRAYYAVYHRAVSVLQNENISLERVNDGGSHNRLITTISKQGLKGQSLAESLIRFKKFRNGCDYNLALEISEKRIAMQVAEARRLIDQLGRLVPE